MLWLDTETYNVTPIEAGTYRYARTAELLLVAWALDDAPAQVWDLSAGEPVPPALHGALADPSQCITAHNSNFDRQVMRRNLPHYPLDIARWRDTMVQALAHSLPAALGTLCAVLRVPAEHAKAADGRRLVRLFCQPRPARHTIKRATRATHPEDWARFVDYARLDVEAMRECARRMPTRNYPGNARELALWHLDQAINDRGVAIDVELAEAAIRAVEAAQADLSRQVQGITRGRVAGASARDALLGYLREQGLDIEDLRAATVEAYLDRHPDLEPRLRTLLEARIEGAANSTAKYHALLRAVSPDARLRGTLQFAGASRTGRWAGRVFQPQNLPRLSAPAAAVEQGIVALKSGAAGIITDDVLGLARDALRGCIIAPPGSRLAAADLSAIEGRVLAWVAGEDWKVRAYREGQDIYVLTYARTFQVPASQVGKPERQVGKVLELALGYGGGVGAFRTFADAYRLDLEALAEQARGALPQALLAAATESHRRTVGEGGHDFGLPQAAWVACDAIKRAWRAQHPATVAFWRELEATYRKLVACEGEGAVSRVTLERKRNWMRIHLPSGRTLCYAAPDADRTLSYLGQDIARTWSRVYSYGGKLAENIVQAVARDVMADAMPRVEAAGYRIVLSVHDELVCEAPAGTHHCAEDLAALMSVSPHWALDLPLKAAGFEGHRYLKE